MSQIIRLDDNKEDVLSHIDSLPDELLLYILKSLPPETLISCENVCKRWNRLARDRALWRRIVLIYSGKLEQSEISEKSLNILTSHSEYIYRLKIQYVEDYTVIKSVMEQCKRLISLELLMCCVTKEFEDDILKWPNLKKLSLKNSVSLAYNTLSIQFDKFKELRYLALSDFGLNSNNCRTLLQCSHLSHIYIEMIRDLDLDFIKILIFSKQRILVAFNIYGGSSVDDDVLQLLSQCPELEDLAILRCEKISDTGLISLTSLKRIQHLQMRNNINFTEVALLKTLGSSALITLRSLILSRVHNVTPVIVDLLSKYYKNLKYLAIYRCCRITSTDYQGKLDSIFKNIDVVLF